MRLQSLDAWKGIAITAVIFIHAFGFLSSSEIGSIPWYFGITVRQFLNFAVPVFFFIAGYLSFSDKYDGAKIFYGKRLKRILPPYIFWSAVYIAFAILISHKTPNLREVSVSILNGTTIEIGYFVIALIQLVVITPALYSIKSIKHHFVILFVISLTGLAYTYLTTLYTPFKNLSEFPYSALPFFVWFAFYHSGFIVSKFNPVVNIKKSFSLIFLFLVISIIEAFSINEYSGYSFSVSQLKLSSMLMSLSVCLLIYSSLKTLKSPEILRKLGMASYGIYLSHILVMRITYKATEVLGVIPKSNIIYCIEIAFVTIIVTYAMCFVAKAITRSKSIYILGY